MPGDLVPFLVIVAIATVIGVGFGIVVLAPRIGRLLDHADENREAGPMEDADGRSTTGD